MDMRKFLSTTLAALLGISSVYAAIPNTSPNPKTFLGPTAHFGVVKSITDDSAFALAAEAGPKNYRGSGTLGWEFDFHHRVKATAEYLRQKLTYSFFTGTQDVWMGQTAVGLNYEYDFRQVDPFNTLLDLTGYYSYSPSKNLGTTTGTYVNSSGVSQSYVDYQRVAGASAFGVSPGIAIQTLDGTRAGLELNYDNVQYDNKNTPGKYSKGLGGTLRLNQAITDDVSIGGAIAVRRPYNNYQANINFLNLEYYGIWAVNGFGEYTVGKNTQPSSYNVGLGADYFIDGNNNFEVPKPPQSMPKKYKDSKNYKDFKDMPAPVWKDPVDTDLLNWVSVPAVKIPNVYSVPDESVVQQCEPPIFSGIIPDDLVTVLEYPIDLSEYFSGSGIVFGVTRNGVPYDPSNYSIVGNILTFFNSGSINDGAFVVTATNGCGVTTSNTFNLTFD